MKNLIFISVQPTDLFFAWQLNIQLYNFRRLGISDRYHILLYTSPERDVHPYFFSLEKEYPEAKFTYFDDKEGKCWRLIKIFNYIPLLRPWCLMQYYKDHPEICNYPVFYLDSDVIFTKRPGFLEKYLNDDISYLSNTRSYIAASYFDSKIKDVIPKRLESYKKHDILEECSSCIGINRAICEENEYNTGGAQYLLKNIDSKFWSDVLDGCMVVRTYLNNINSKFFESEDKGFQSWCADMWSVLWNLWKLGIKTSTPDEFDFLWSGSPIADWGEYNIYHDAQPLENCFDKMKYRDNKLTPYDDDLSYINKEVCSYKYVQEIFLSRSIFNKLKQ